MSSNNNFLLKIHMEEENNITEIYVNKERRSFTFLNDECVSDLIIPEFKITSLNMILENTNDGSGYESYFAEYEKNGETEREFDHEKIAIIKDMVTKVSINDFLDCINEVKVNDYYVDNVVDAYNCVLPIEMKKILSYTTNGVVFSDAENFEMMDHDSITIYKGEIKNFIPFLIRNGENYIGFDHKEALYKEYKDSELVKEAKHLDALINTKTEKIEELFEATELEVLLREKTEKEETVDITDIPEITTEVDAAKESEEVLEVVEDKEEQAQVEEEYNRTIQNIDLQLERLSVGIVETDKKEKKKDPIKPEKKMSKDLISDEVGKEAEEMLVKIKVETLKDKLEHKKEQEEQAKKEKTLISEQIAKEAEEVLKRIEKEEIQAKKQRKPEAHISEEIAKEAEEVLGKILAQEEEAKDKKTLMISEKIAKEAEELLGKMLKKKEEKTVISKEVAKEAEQVLKKIIARENKDKETKKIMLSREIVKEAQEVLEKITAREKKEKAKKLPIISKEVAKEAEKILNKIKVDENRKKEEVMLNNINKKIQSAIIEYEIRESVRKNLDEIEKTNKLIDEINATITKANDKEEEQIKERLSISDLVNNSILNGINNYRINLNDTQKLVVEHLPYYEFTNDFSVIQIPEIEFDKITLLPNAEIDFGKIKFVVEKLYNDKVDLLVLSSNSIVDKDNNKIKKGSRITVNLKSEITLRLNKKDVMETWTLRMEKSTFEKELRNIDYGKVMNYITKLDSYKKLGNIEKYELKKSVMLFVDFVMQYNEENKLNKLYDILEKEPTLYEEYITKFNIKHSQEYKDVLPTYEDKKKYVTKLNYINGLIDAKWLDYPRYIFNSHNYFYNNELLEDFVSDLNRNLTETDFSDYLTDLFDEYDFFKELDETGKMNLEKCLEYLSVLYKYKPDLGEDNKYKIEKAFMIGETEEDIALLISKLCRKGIRDYSAFVEYDSMIKEKYRLGDLKYPIYSNYFELDEIRKGGEYDEF